MISIACLIFFGTVPDDDSFLRRVGSVLLLSIGALKHELSFYNFFSPISIFLKKIHF